MRQQESARATHPSAHAAEHVVPTATYVKVGLVLAIITAVEFGIVYVEALRPVLIPSLVILSVAKFALVAGYFMHLKFDRRVLTGFFVVGILLALATYLALAAIFSYR